MHPGNEEFITFIPDADVAAVLKDEIPDMPRRFAVQAAKSSIEVSLTSSDFATFKKIVRSQNTELIKKVEAQLPELMGKVNEGIKEKFDVEIALSVFQVVPLPVHEETERTLAYSSLVKYDMKDEMGNPTAFVGVSTATFVHVKGKVLFLYSYAEESGLEWSQQASHKWASDVVTSNPSAFQAMLKETIPSSVLGFDWGKIAENVVIGAIMGLVIVLLGCFFKSSNRMNDKRN